VYVHPPFLRTLGKREVLNGVAEMIKHGLVRDAATGTRCAVPRCTIWMRWPR
jgi:3-dehydroquinate synthetase